MIIVFVGRPESGKGTQAELLGKELGIPVVAMGDLIRNAREAGNSTIAEAYKQYSLQGKHLPNAIKFPLLKEKLDQSISGFILDNYPANEEDLKTFNEYVESRGLRVDKVFHLVVSEQETLKRLRSRSRGRLDDKENIVQERLRIQDEEREAVLAYFREQGILEDIDGEGDKNAIHGEIMSRLGISQREKNGI